MGRIKKQTAHLRLIAKASTITISALTTAAAAVVDRPTKENVVYVPVVQDVSLERLSNDQQLHKDNGAWGEISTRPENNHDDAETDDEDWSKQPSKDSNNNRKTWDELQHHMQFAATAAASSTHSTRPYIGTSRSNIFRKKQAQKKASKGTPTLLSFGFGRSNTDNHVVVAPPAEAANTKDGPDISKEL
ncbi:unnamed protein product [Mortierella alpina]